MDISAALFIYILLHLYNLLQIFLTALPPTCLKPLSTLVWPSYLHHLQEFPKQSLCLSHMPLQLILHRELVQPFKMTKMIISSFLIIFFIGFPLCLQKRPNGSKNHVILAWYNPCLLLKLHFHHCHADFFEFLKYINFFST